MLFLVIFYIELMLFKIAFRHVVSEGNFKTLEFLVFIPPKRSACFVRTFQ